MVRDPYAGLSAREREMMDVVHRLGEATARDVRKALTDAPTDATVRSTLRVLEDKGWLEHRRESGRFIYRAVNSQDQVRQAMVQHVIHTFFEDSPAELMAALVDRRGGRLRAGERERIHELLERLEKREKGK